MNRSERQTALFAAAFVFMMAVLGCGIADKYQVNFGLKADMSDRAPDPNSVAVLDTPQATKKPVVVRPPQEIMTTEGMDEALDDDFDQFAAVAEAVDSEKAKAASDGGAPAAR